MKLAAKIRARLKQKFPGVNLSNKRIDAIAAKLAKKLTDESEDADIDSALDDINDITPFADIAKDDDRIRTIESKRKAGGTDNDEDDEEEEEAEPAKPAKTRKSKDEPPAWAQKLMQDLEAIKGDRQKATIADKVKAHPKLKDIPEKYLKGRALPEKEEDIDAFVDTVEADYSDFMQEMVDQGLSSTASKPILGTANKDGISTEVASYIASKSEADKPGGDLGGKKI